MQSHDAARLVTRSRCGEWPSPISAERVATGSLRLSLPRLDRGALYWLEVRSSEGGCGVVMRADLDRSREPWQVSAPGQSVRSRVHEYGGGEYLVQAGALFAVHDADGSIHRRDPEGWRRLAACVSGVRYADLALSPDRRCLVAVEEDPRGEREPRNALVALDLESGERRLVDAHHDFVSSPVFAPDGRRLAWLSWDHPNMPWDGTTLWVATWGPGGVAGEPLRVAGGPDESVFQPAFSPRGVLTFVSDRSGFWNLYQLGEGACHALCPRQAEFGSPQWVFGLSAYGFVDEDVLLCVVREDGSDSLARLDRRSGRLEKLPLPYSAIEGVRVERGWACFLAAGPRAGLAVRAMRLFDGRVRQVRASQAEGVDPSWVSAPEPISFRSQRGHRSHAFFYRPHHPVCTLAAGERPPLLIKAHGGPSAAAAPVLDWAVQYWTSRGFAVVDVNYAGSTGYGRAYRQLLEGKWGVVDVEDCLAAARHLIRHAGVDPARIAMRGGSAGGFSVLCALVFHHLLSAGASYYGVGDLEALVRDTHKFEARYLDRLVGPYPERRDRYRERSPIHAVERLKTPTIVFQGTEDRVVPPSQAEAIVAALADRGVPHAYLSFPGEGHGFRRAESQITALEAELYFYGRVFGFEPEVSTEVRALVDRTFPR